MSRTTLRRRALLGLLAGSAACAATDSPAGRSQSGGSDLSTSSGGSEQSTDDNAGDGSPGSTGSASGSTTGVHGTSRGADSSEGGNDDPPPSRCQVSAAFVSCERETDAFEGRTLYWQTPLGTPPPAGWPVVVLFHGSFFGPDDLWEGGAELPFGGFHQLRLQAALLDAGFALFTPEAAGGVAWATNFPPGPAADPVYLASGDHRMMLALLDAFESGEFGPIDTGRQYATGISSGGYMTSRMAENYPGEFRALAIHSAAYATCSNLLCVVPDPLPTDHPPTLFLHGQLDVIVPMSTMVEYVEQMADQGLEHAEVIDPTGTHAWLEQAPQEIVEWFQSHE
ncbi:MAG: hypothetical protein KUG77_14360 [Nannocystaceae bacterium]|nr:hypothetical protein [Nannocystaceae bacterium]